MKKTLLHPILPVLLWALPLTAGPFDAYRHYSYDPNDFAIECLDYRPVGMSYDWLSNRPYNNPDAVLGRPTVDTTGDDWYIPEDRAIAVNPVYSPFRAHEILFLGEGGSVTVRFSHPVRDDTNNPYGIDLLVFGNAIQVTDNSQGFIDADPRAILLGPDGFAEPGVVSVSQDGIHWYAFTSDPNFMAGNPLFTRLPADASDGPFCDGFAPTLGRVYQPDQPDPALGPHNSWWGPPTNPTLPLDPALRFDSFAGQTLADLCRAYGYSAGGTGYDLDRLDLPADPDTGLKWIQYVRVDDRPGGGNAEIDAFADVSACGDWKHPFPAGDLNQDCRVTLDDVACLSARWLQTSDPAVPATAAPRQPADTVNDLTELAAIAEAWLTCSWNCP